jgi:hypothetical protein
MALFSSRRAFSLGFTIVALLIGGWKMVLPGLGGSGGASSQDVDRAISQAAGSAAAAGFGDADAALADYRARSGTYAGATAPPGDGVVVARADVSGYCLQAQVGPVLEHEDGPGGQPSLGAC